ncbi:MAG: DUF6776 family protein [Pseudomonadota bacterium]
MTPSYQHEDQGLHLSPNQRRMVVGVVVLLMLGAGAVGFWVARQVDALDADYLVALETMRDVYERRLTTAQRELIDTRLAYDVERQTLAAVRDDLATAHGRAVQLDEEVTFYRSLMAPDRLAKGLQIAEFEATRRTDGQISFHLLLTQIASRRTWVAGQVEVLVSGRNRGAAEDVVLPLTEIAVVEKYPLSYRFRYFQDLTGEFSLPSDFEPTEVQIRVTPTKGKPLERRFPWTVS